MKAAFELLYESWTDARALETKNLPERKKTRKQTESLGCEAKEKCEHHAHGKCGKQESLTVYQCVR